MTDTEQLRRIAVRAGIMGSHGTQVPMHKLEAFASLLLDEENEACAVICEEIRDFTAANEIRARRKA
jgi:hypothetical protein